MIEQTDAVTMSLMRLALDAATLRHQAIANNIANAGTPGYAPARVSFEDQLDAVRASLSRGQPMESAMLADVRPVIRRAAPAAGEPSAAALDLEVAQLSENTVHYEALLKGLSKHLSILSTAINEGKR